MLFVRHRLPYIFVFCFLAASSSFHHSQAGEASIDHIREVQQNKRIQETTSAHNYPHISFDSPQYDAGEVYEGAVIAHDFIVKNTGTALLDITDVKPG
jgi:hypothetical protein